MAGWRRIAVCLTLGCCCRMFGQKHLQPRLRQTAEGQLHRQVLHRQTGRYAVLLPGSPTAKSAIWPESTRYARLIASEVGQNCGRAAAHRPKPPPRAKPSSAAIAKQTPPPRALPAVGVGRPAPDRAGLLQFRCRWQQGHRHAGKRASRFTLPPRQSGVRRQTSCALRQPDRD